MVARREAGVAEAEVGMGIRFFMGGELPDSKSAFHCDALSLTEVGSVGTGVLEILVGDPEDVA